MRYLFLFFYLLHIRPDRCFLKCFALQSVCAKTANKHPSLQKTHRIRVGQLTKSVRSCNKHREYKVGMLRSIRDFFLRRNRSSRVLETLLEPLHSSKDHLSGSKPYRIRIQSRLCAKRRPRTKLPKQTQPSLTCENAEQPFRSQRCLLTYMHMHIMRQTLTQNTKPRLCSSVVKNDQTLQLTTSPCIPGPSSPEHARRRPVFSASSTDYDLLRLPF